MDMEHIGETIKQRRKSLRMSIRSLAAVTGVSPSHISRMERGDRLPSGHTLQKIAQPLGFTEEELFAQAGFLSDSKSPTGEEKFSFADARLDPLVAQQLAEEPISTQRAVIGILHILKSIRPKI